MQSQVIGIVVFLVISVFAAIVWHRRSGRYLVASIGAGCTTAVVSQIVLQALTWGVYGHIDPLFATVGLLTTMVVGAAIGLGIGGVLRLVGKSPARRDRDASSAPASP